MTTPNNQKPSNQTGMTLVEIIVTLGIVATVLLALVALFGQSVGTVHKSQSESVSIFIAEIIHSRLMTDPEWPPGIKGQTFSRDVDEHGMPTDKFVYDDLYFDTEGNEIIGEVDPDAAVGFKAFQGILTFSRSPNYASSRLDYIAFEVKPVKGPNNEPITFSFQRAYNVARDTP
jgi:type II secretory pathway pseudopilin PulG